MKKFLVTGSALLLAVVVTGCDKLDTAVSTVSKGVDHYCGISEAQREIVRDKVHEAVAPHSITVHCDGDHESKSTE